MGRNIVRHENVAQVCVAIAALIHENVSVDEAMEILNQ